MSLTYKNAAEYLAALRAKLPEIVASGRHRSFANRKLTIPESMRSIFPEVAPDSVMIDAMSNAMQHVLKLAGLADMPVPEDHYRAIVEQVGEEISRNMSKCKNTWSAAVGAALYGDLREASQPIDLISMPWAYRPVGDKKHRIVKASGQHADRKMPAPRIPETAIGTPALNQEIAEQKPSFDAAVACDPGFAQKLALFLGGKIYGQRAAACVAAGLPGNEKFESDVVGVLKHDEIGQSLDRLRKKISEANISNAAQALGIYLDGENKQIDSVWFLITKIVCDELGLEFRADSLRQQMENAEQTPRVPSFVENACGPMNFGESGRSIRTV